MGQCSAHSLDNFFGNVYTISPLCLKQGFFHQNCFFKAFDFLVSFRSLLFSPPHFVFTPHSSAARTVAPFFSSQSAPHPFAPLVQSSHLCNFDSYNPPFRHTPPPQCTLVELLHIFPFLTHVNCSSLAFPPMGPLLPEVPHYRVDLLFFSFPPKFCLFFFDREVVTGGCNPYWVVSATRPSSYGLFLSSSDLPFLFFLFFSRCQTFFPFLSFPTGKS